MKHLIYKNIKKKSKNNVKIYKIIKIKKYYIYIK